MRVLFGAVLVLAVSPLCGVASADDDWAPIIDDPLAVPLAWLDDRRAPTRDGDIEIVQDELIEPWAAEARPRSTKRDDQQLACDCVCGDVLTPSDWR